MTKLLASLLFLYGITHAALILDLGPQSYDATARSGGGTAGDNLDPSLGSDATLFNSGEVVYASVFMTLEGASDFTTIDDDGETLRAFTRIQTIGDGASNISNFDVGFVSTDGGTTVNLFVGDTVLGESFAYGTEYQFLLRLTSQTSTGGPQFIIPTLDYALNPTDASTSFVSGAAGTGANNGAMSLNNIFLGSRFPATWGDGSGTTDVNFSVGGVEYGTDLNDFSYTAIPEPGTLTLGGLALGLLIVSRRRR